MSAHLPSEITIARDREFEFTDSDFERVRQMIYVRAGISLNKSKQDMVYSRLARRLRATGIRNFSDYLSTLTERGSDITFRALSLGAVDKSSMRICLIHG